MGILERLFSKKEVLIDPISPGLLINDLHSHLIPGIDDGSPEMETTISLLEKFIELGYQKVITTPHIMSDYYKNTSDIIHRGLDDVKNEIDKRNLKMHFETLKITNFTFFSFFSLFSKIMRNFVRIFT